jgi:hypothetical protein
MIRNIIFGAAATAQFTLAITASHAFVVVSPSPVKVGNTGSVTVTVSNTGTGNYTGADPVITLPAGFTVTSQTVTGNLTAGQTKTWSYSVTANSVGSWTTTATIVDKSASATTTVQAADPVVIPWHYDPATGTCVQGGFVIGGTTSYPTQAACNAANPPAPPPSASWHYDVVSGTCVQGGTIIGGTPTYSTLAACNAANPSGPVTIAQTNSPYWSYANGDGSNIPKLFGETDAQALERLRGWHRDWVTREINSVTISGGTYILVPPDVP